MRFDALFLNIRILDNQVSFKIHCVSIVKGQIVMYQIKVYQKKNKDLPFDDWLEDQDSAIKNMILAKLKRISLPKFIHVK